MELSGFLVDETQVDTRIRVVRHQLDGLVEILRRIKKVTILSSKDTQVVVGRSIEGVSRGRLPKQTPCLPRIP